MPDSPAIVKFRDRAIRPPRGQWSYTIAGTLVTKYSESEIIDEIRKFKQNNGTFTSDEDIQRELWAYYCEREPKRCRGYQPRLSPDDPPSNLQPRNLTKEVQGPWIWQALNMAAVKFRKEFFLQFAEEILTWLECPKCKAEWHEILRSDSPHKITTAKEACVWVNRVHNRVNRRIGKPEYPYTRMIQEYGAPL